MIRNAFRPSGVYLVENTILLLWYLIFGFNSNDQSENLMELVYFRMKPGEYPLFQRLSQCFALYLLNVLIWELVRRYLFISPIATPLLAPGG